jgi:hypothetical protein
VYHKVKQQWRRAGSSIHSPCCISYIMSGHAAGGGATESSQKQDVEKAIKAAEQRLRQEPSVNEEGKQADSQLSRGPSSIPRRGSRQESGLASGNTTTVSGETTTAPPWEAVLREEQHQPSASNPPMERGSISGSGVVLSQELPPDHTGTGAIAASSTALPQQDSASRTQATQQNSNFDSYDHTDSRTELEQKREASRISSRKSQERKKQRIDFLSFEKNRLTQANSAIRDENQYIRNEIARLKKALKEPLSSAKNNAARSSNDGGGNNSSIAVPMPAEASVTSSSSSSGLGHNMFGDQPTSGLQQLLNQMKFQQPPGNDQLLRGLGLLLGSSTERLPPANNPAASSPLQDILLSLIASGSSQTNMQYQQQVPTLSSLLSGGGISIGPASGGGSNFSNASTPSLLAALLLSEQRNASQTPMSVLLAQMQHGTGNTNHDQLLNSLLLQMGLVATQQQPTTNLSHLLPSSASGMGLGSSTSVLEHINQFSGLLASLQNIAASNMGSSGGDESMASTSHSTNRSSTRSSDDDLVNERSPPASPSTKRNVPKKK